MRGEDIAARLLDFAVRVLRLAQALPKSFAGKHVGNQLVRSGTSAGSNFEEARGAESRADFAHKVGLSWKEMRESWFWLRVIRKAEMVKASRIEDLIRESEELTRILGASRSTVRHGRKKAKDQPSNS